jgi:arsenical pump membrane protein
MWLPALAALLITAAVIIGFEHRNLGRPTTPQPAAEKPDVGLGLFAIIVATVLVVALHSPALPVVVVGLIATVVRLGTGRDHLAEVTEGLGVPILVGLFGLAVTLGTVGRLWSGPSALLSHLNVWGTAAMAAASSVVINNLPAASLLSARTPSHPFALLIGLNLGPNLFVTGSLAWLIWYRSAKNAGADPQIGGASRIGLVAVPLSIAAAVGLLALTGSS